MRTPRRLESRRYSRLENLRYEFCRSICLFLILSFLLTVLGSGCASNQSQSSTSAVTSSSRSSDIVELVLTAMPLSVNLDATPGPDGFAIKVYAVEAKHPKPQPLKNGTLEVMIWDGPLNEIPSDPNQFRHRWSFTAAQLQPYAVTTLIGTGYNLTLAWGDDKPEADNFTVAVRYHPPRGPAIISAPSSISMLSK